MSGRHRILTAKPNERDNRSGGAVEKFRLILMRGKLADQRPVFLITHSESYGPAA
jgi:hypothetical protein